MRSTGWLLTSLMLVATGCDFGRDQPPPGGGLTVPPDPPAIPLEMQVTHASRPLPPIIGGTMDVAKVGDASFAVAADTDHDRIWVGVAKNAQNPSLRSAIQLEQGAEPGRVRIDGQRAYVLLRHAGELAVVDLPSATLQQRVPLCTAPRGIDIDHDADLMAIACMDGELRLLQASTLDPLATYQLDRDLRDVVIRGEEILVSRFRSAEMIVVFKDGTVRGRGQPATMFSQTVDPQGAPQQTPSTPSVAWRMAPASGGGAVVVHQRGTDGQVAVTRPGGYGGGGMGCGPSSIVSSSISVLGRGQVVSSGSLPAGLVVDVASGREGQLAIAIAANSPTDLETGQSFGVPTCEAPASTPLLFDGLPTEEPLPSVDNVQVVRGIAVGFLSSGMLVTQQRKPAGLNWNGTFLPFGDDAEVTDSGHQIFHMDSGNGLACASCHPEGGDDGRVWNFEKLGPRRTQPLHGGIKGSEPFHWSGDMSDFSVLMGDVFTHRMGGPKASPAQAVSVLDWVDTIPNPPAARPSTDEAAVRGQALFASAEVGCATCHQGNRLDGPDSVNVGTGEAFQVPTLRGLAYRAPYLHDGSARTLRERFNQQGGGDQHGSTSHLDENQLSDLVAYLESL